MRGRARGQQAAASTLSFPVQATSVGAVTANQFTGWTHGAGSIFSSSDYGTTARYFRATSDASLSATSRAVSRDQEVTFWASIGDVYLRVLNNTALRCRANNTGSGGWRVDFVVIGSSGYESDTYISELGSGTPSGLNTSSTAGDLYVFGVSGFDVYVKWNGVEQWREKQILAIKPGQVAFRTGADAGFGLRSLSVEFKQSAALYSSPERDILEVRDFGLKSLTAVGSITGGSSTLTLVSNPGFAIGDKIIVETGGESGGGLYGTRGVGGQWPTLTYANATVRNADTSQPANKLAGQLDNGLVYRWTGSTWVQYITTTSAYFQKIQPKALLATITNVSGTTLTLNTAATVSTTAANVYFNNLDVYLEALGVNYASIPSYVANKTIEWPAQEFAFGTVNDRIELVYGTDNWSHVGQGVASSVIHSPKGATSLNLLIGEASGVSIRDLHFRSNQNWDGGFVGIVDANEAPTQTSFSVLQWQNTPSPTATDCRFTDMVCTFGQSDGGSGTRLDFVQTTGHMEYVGWVCQASGTDGFTFTDITMSGPNIFGGVEFFLCENATINGMTSTNARHAVNTGSNLNYLGFDITMEEGCADDARSWYFIQGEPIVTMATNIGGIGSNILFDDFRVTIEGPVKVSTNYDLRVFVVGGGLSDVTISGDFPAKPNTSGLIDLYAGYDVTAIDISSAVTGMTISGVRVKGGSATTDIASPNATSVVQNCVADAISTGGTTSGNIDNAAYEAL